MHFPTDYDSQKKYWEMHAAKLVASFTSGQHSFIPCLLPETAVRLPACQVLEILEKRLGKKTLAQALSPDSPFRTPNSEIPIPNSEIRIPHSNWLRRTNIAGINVRTIQSFWNVVKYALTLPACQGAIHLLPIWEPGVVESLYGIASWNINPEFFSEELREAQPHLDTVEKQLVVTVNLLHALGKAVGMDVIPHTDRYSEIVLANPHFFEWLRRKGTKITDHSNNLHEKVQDAILVFLKKNGGNGLTYPTGRQVFFSEKTSEAFRSLVLFGSPEDPEGRRKRRSQLMDFLFRKGYEPVPATMAPPYRGLKVDTRRSAVTRDDKGRVWRDYVIEQPQPMSRVFGPLTRFKFYENRDDNRRWKIDFSKPRREVWDYFCERYASVCRTYDFDFMRGDMSHVQMRPGGVPAEPVEYYDPLGAVKRYIQQEKPHFGYFAESFLAPAGIMAYGDEIDHLEFSGADTALGDLQSMVPGSAEFLQNFRWYLDIGAARSVAPTFTVMTGDKDDPRFDKFYVGGNEARLFTALFLPDMPSYMGLGFECRDVHLSPAPNEHYTKLFVFKIGEGDKATHGNYVWGKNAPLFANLLNLRLYAEKILTETGACTTFWLLPPDPTGHKKLVAWSLREQPHRLFLVNFDVQYEAVNVKIPLPPSATQEGVWRLDFSTCGAEEMDSSTLVFNGKNLALAALGAGEGRVYVMAK
jgi:hypothetical protein